MLHGFRVEHLDRAHHRDTGIVRMRAVQKTIENDATVQMDDRPVRRPFPAAHPLTGSLVVLPDVPVRDRVEMVLVDRHPLSGLLRPEAADFLEPRWVILGKNGRPREEAGCEKQPTDRGVGVDPSHTAFLGVGGDGTSANIDGSQRLATGRGSQAIPPAIAAPAVTTGIWERRGAEKQPAEDGAGSGARHPGLSPAAHLKVPGRSRRPQGADDRRGTDDRHARVRASGG